MYVARLLSEALGGGSVESLSGERLRKPSEFEVDADSPSEPVVWVFPTYSWGVPPVVADFIREVSFGKNALMARHYMVTTCGDDMGRADRQWRKLLGRRGITGESAYSVQMPNTYVCMKGFDVDSPEVARAKIESARTRVEAIAGSIISRGRDMLVRGSFAGLKTGVVYPWFVRFAMSPKPFGVTEVCRGCGLVQEPALWVIYLWWQGVKAFVARSGEISALCAFAVTICAPMARCRMARKRTARDGIQ